MDKPDGPLAPREAADALARIPLVNAEAAAEFVEHRAVYRLGDRVAVALPANDAVTGEAVLYVPVCWPLPHETADYADLIAALANVERDYRAAVVRLDRETMPPAGLTGCRPVSFYLEADPDALVASLRAGEEVAVRAAVTEAEWQLVRDLLAEAIAAAHQGVGEVPPTGDIRAAVERLLAGDDGEPRPTSLIARVGGELAAHITFQAGWVDEVTRRSYHRVIDVFVLESYRSSGVTDALTRSVADLARQHGQPLLGEVTWDRAGQWERVLDHLRCTGWRGHHVLVHIELDKRAGLAMTAPGSS